MRILLDYHTRKGRAPIPTPSVEGSRKLPYNAQGLHLSVPLQLFFIPTSPSLISLNIAVKIMKK